MQSGEMLQSGDRVEIRGLTARQNLHFLLKNLRFLLKNLHLYIKLAGAPAAEWIARNRHGYFNP